MTREVPSEFSELIRERRYDPFSGVLKTGMSLGTTNIVIVVTGESNHPIAGATAVSKVVKDGIVVDSVGAMQTVRRLKVQLEKLFGVPLETTAAATPPGVIEGNVRYIASVVEEAGFEMTHVIDEPTTAASVLGIRDGVVVDVGDGTTGVNILEDGEVTFTADEPAGGTHVTLVLAGCYGVSIKEAEKLKTDKDRGRDAFPVIKPVVGKMASIVRGFLSGYEVDCVHIVGGASCFSEFEHTFEKALGIKTIGTSNALLVAPLDIA